VLINASTVTALLKILILSDFLEIFGWKRVNCDEMDGDRL